MVDNRNGKDEFVIGKKIGYGKGSVCPQNSSKTARDTEIPANTKKLNLSETVRDRENFTKNQ